MVHSAQCPAVVDMKPLIHMFLLYMHRVTCDVYLCTYVRTLNGCYMWGTAVVHIAQLCCNVLT